jgi:hypothetical protein
MEDQSKPQFCWVKDADGDESLEAYGEHYGVACPHHDGYIKVVWDWGMKVSGKPTMDEAKRFLEKCAIADHAGEVERDRVWDEINA